MATATKDRAKPKTHTSLHTDPAKFMALHQRQCSGTFKNILSSGNTEHFSCKLCESTYRKTWRLYNQFKFKGQLVQIVIPVKKQMETKDATQI